MSHICAFVWLYCSEATRKRAFNLVARAYSCISVEDLSAFVGMTAADAVDGIYLLTLFVCVHRQLNFIHICLLTFTFTFGADNRSRPALRPCIFGQMRNPNTTKGQENLLVALANRRRVVDLTLPNSSGSMVCAPIMEYLDTIHRHNTNLGGGMRFPLLHMLGIVDQFGCS